MRPIVKTLVTAATLLAGATVLSACVAEPYGYNDAYAGPSYGNSYAPTYYAPAPRVEYNYYPRPRYTPPPPRHHRPDRDRDRDRRDRRDDRRDDHRGS